jgi:hypothetical protein
MISNRISHIFIEFRLSHLDRSGEQYYGSGYTSQIF